MKTACEKIWESGEYKYEAAYGFEPNIHAFIHEDGIRDALIVVPGGGYCMCVPPEAEIVAKKFYELGLNTFVLTYTTDITMSVPLKKQPFYDLARAVRFVRAKSTEYCLGNKLFICGFSAGAHVCGTLAVHYDDAEEKNAGYSAYSCHPDGVILSYPVITTGEYTHIYSVQALIGKNPTEQELNYFSLEKNVTDKTPPCFIWQTATDNLVPVQNSYLFAHALKEKNIPFAHYVFPEGFHGLSIADKDFFDGNFGKPYTMEQVKLAVKAVKAGEGVNVSAQRRAELEEQFSDKNKQPEPQVKINPDDFKDVSMWPDLAISWMKRI